MSSVIADPNGIDCLNYPNLHPSILDECRQTYTKALPVLYGDNHSRSRVESV